MLKTQLIGHLGQDAIVRHWNGKRAISFTVAYNESYTDSNGTKHETTTWVNCTLWREGDTKLPNYLRKGQLIYVEGTPNVKTYVSKTTGEVLPDFQLNVKQLQLLGGAATAGNVQENPEPQPETAEPAKAKSAEKAPAGAEETVPWEE
ncbi:single-stranded DNA-binding protein [Phaeodactylibacter xiamenensis]|uniref:single-stranded DNA-binding protein n=1 Tax=Phaeodactylibacter xiamenensis TaxID=1524460 RepID=UPI0024A993E3|nr:single-stranded DNA-binding protein [Phaeodactylibacter xiamenensis]